MTAAVLAIGGIDPTGLAGLAADIRAGAAAGVHVATAVSALTVQNGRGVFRVEPVEPELLIGQVKAVLQELSVGAIKIGLLPERRSLELVMTVRDAHGPLPVVMDPVMSATSGGRLSRLTLADIVAAGRRGGVLLTPNLDEAEWLLGMRKVRNLEEMKGVAVELVEKTGCAVLLKGGHLEEGETVADVLCDGRIVRVFRTHRVSAQARGTGCTLATLVAAGIACGRELGGAVTKARRMMTEAFERIALENAGEGIPPVLPLWPDGDCA